MPEVNALYAVTAAVVLGLVAWVAVVLKTAKEPWARESPKPVQRNDDVPLEAPAEKETTSEGARTESAGTSKVAAAEEAVVDAGADAKADADAKS
jgi:hypothetical protein